MRGHHQLALPACPPSWLASRKVLGCNFAEAIVGSCCCARFETSVLTTARAGGVNSQQVSYAGERKRQQMAATLFNPWIWAGGG